MKKVRLIVSFLLICITSFNVFGQDSAEAESASSPETFYLTPITWEIVNLIQNSGKNFNELNFYLSKPFTMVINEQYDSPKIEIQDGALVMPDGDRTLIQFSSNQQGILHGFPVSGSNDIFEVVFQVGDRTAALKFKRNRQNYFELFSALIDTKPYTLSSNTDLALLAVSSSISVIAVNEVRASPYIAQTTSTQTTQTTAAQTTAPTTAAVNGFVEGKGSFNKSQIIAYIKRQNPSLDDNFIDKLIDTYIAEAAFENINHDIAIAQMLYATSFLKGPKFVSSNNYGGLLELPSWDGAFVNMTDGVRAHIQHLKGYASVTMNNNQIVDPRYYLLINLKYLGTVKTFDQLYARWVSSSACADYKRSIELILAGLSN